MKKNGTCDLLIPGRLLERCRKIVFFTFFLFFLTFPMLASAYAQLRKVSFEVQNVNLAEIIAILEKSTNYTFLYQDEQVERVKNLTFHFVDEKLSDVLEKCLADTDLDYSIVDQTVVLRLKDTKPQEQPQVNSHKVSGVVTDKNGVPLPGVTVMLKGTTTGVATDMDGKFVLEIPQTEQMVLVCSFVGMETREVTWQGEKELTVVLTEKIAEMDEVVVTGIYERKSESFTGSATTFKSEELKRIGGQNVLQSLKTLDPSFTIMESRDYGSDPNRLPDIEIRGKSSVIGLKEEFGTDPNQPLFILDGFETDLKTVVDMNMDRVASVTILKDAASTAIYGSKAANGVVVIETKKPERVRILWNRLFSSAGKILSEDFWRYTLPVLAASLVWGIAYVLYSVIMGHMGSDAVAANSITSIAKSLLSCLIRGVSGGAGVLIGNLLGADELEKAREYGGRLTHLAIAIGVVTGGLLMLISPAIVHFAPLTDTAAEYLQYMLLFCGLNLMAQSVNTTVLDGIFCAGGDAKFDMQGNIGAMWCFSVPLGFLAAFWLKLPVMVVYCIVNLDEIVKLPAVYLHYKKYVWVRNITRDIEE